MMTMIVIIGNYNVAISILCQSCFTKCGPAQPSMGHSTHLKCISNSPNPLIETNSICPEIGEVWREVEVDQQCNV